VPWWAIASGEDFSGRRNRGYPGEAPSALTLVVPKDFIEWSCLLTVYETGEVANLVFELPFTG